MTNMTDIETNNLMLLARILPALESQDEALAFLRELCTPKEAKFLAQRAGIAELIMQQVSHKRIMEVLGNPSSATVCRVNDMVQSGGGYLCRLIARASGVEGS